MLNSRDLHVGYAVLLLIVVAELTWRWTRTGHQHDYLMHLQASAPLRTEVQAPEDRACLGQQGILSRTLLATTRMKPRNLSAQLQDAPLMQRHSLHHVGNTVRVTLTL
jgi:hypothetical protein